MDPMRRMLSRAAREFIPASLYYWFRYVGEGQLRSPFARIPPTVRSFSASGRFKLRETLTSVNTLGGTALCRAMAKHGSDKGLARHNYTTVYHVLFHDMRQRPLRIFELGLGTNNPDLPSSMGAGGRPGASLRGWRDYFPHAAVFGADIDRTILFEETRIQTFYCDQLDRAAIDRLWRTEVLGAPFDILIDDGLHTFDANDCFFRGSIHKLAPTGVYIIEDVTSDELDRWRVTIEREYLPAFSSLEFHIVELPAFANSPDNNLVLACHGPA